MKISRIDRPPHLAAKATLGLVECLGTSGPTPRPALLQAIESTLTELRERFAGATAGQIPQLQPARELYRSIGLDPTRHRPSPEALMRRILRGDPFPMVHPAVDLGNLWALSHGLPVGLYDLSKLTPPLTLRLGRPGESYAGIRKDEIHLEGRLTLADARGPFGNPTADSLRTAVDEASRDLLFVLFAPPSFPADQIEHWLGWLAEAVGPLLGAQESGWILPPPEPPS